MKLTDIDREHLTETIYKIKGLGTGEITPVRAMLSAAQLKEIRYALELTDKMIDLVDALNESLEDYKQIQDPTVEEKVTYTCNKYMNDILRTTVLSEDEGEYDRRTEKTS